MTFLEARQGDPSSFATPTVVKDPSASADQRYLTWQHWLKAAGIENVDTRGGYEGLG